MQPQPHFVVLAPQDIFGPCEVLADPRKELDEGSTAALEDFATSPPGVRKVMTTSCLLLSVVDALFHHSQWALGCVSR
jgi:hypothetical protein